MKAKCKIKKVRNGFTLLELLVGLALMSLAALFITQLHVMVNKNQQNYIIKLESEIDSIFAERIIFADLKSMSFSYNNLIIADDNGNNFFDFIPDVPQSFIKSSLQSRVITLGDKNTIVFIVQDTKSGSMMVYNPISAYDLGSTPIDPNVAADLNYVSINKNDYIKTVRPHFWEDDKILFFDSSARVRPSINSFGEVDMNVPPRSSIFLGQVKGKNFAGLSGLSSIVNFKNPLTGFLIDTIDNFLTTVPSSGGGIPIVRVVAVKIIKYQLVAQPAPKNNLYNLIRTQYDGSNFVSQFMIAKDLLGITFKRDSITEKVTYFTITRPGI